MPFNTIPPVFSAEISAAQNLAGDASATTLLDRMDRRDRRTCSAVSPIINADHPRAAQLREEVMIDKATGLMYRRGRSGPSKRVAPLFV